jgi:YidC/Oxa1 family membrane protein insertase
MLATIWNTLLIKPIFNTLVILIYYTGSLGISIILLTLILKTVLLPANIPTIRMSAKRKDLEEELNEIKKKYTDKTEAARQQMEVYKKHGINPASGCLPNIIQLFVLIALYAVFNDFLHGKINLSYFYFDFLKGVEISPEFLYLNLYKPDPFFILPVLAGLAQFFMSKMLLPKIKKAEKTAEKTPETTDDLMYSMQEQMMYISPIMTVVIGATLPSGLILYWFISSLYSLVQNILLKRFLEKNK